MSDKIYAALWKLMEYEGTGLTQDEIMDGKLLAGWIPVEERLPEKNINVLVTTGDEEIGMDFIDKDGKWFFGEMDYEVLTWMPAPELYQ